MYVVLSFGSEIWSCTQQTIEKTKGCEIKMLRNFSAWKDTRKRRWFPDKNKHYCKENLGEDEITLSARKSCGKCVARHGMEKNKRWLIQKRKCISGGVEMVVCPTHKNDERRSRKLHWMEEQVELAKSTECVGHDGYTLGKRERLDDQTKRAYLAEWQGTSSSPAFWKN